MGKIQSTFNDKYEEYMQNFLCRLLRHDFVVSYINDFFEKNERTYYSFFMLMKVLGAHTDLKFQTNYWSDCYIYFYEKLGIHGILFIPLLLSKGCTDDKKKIIKKYLNEHINNTKERITLNSNLVINLLEFKKVILTYISCVSTRGLENVIKAMDNNPKEAEFLSKPEIKKEIKDYRKLYSNQLVESFVDVLLRPYSRQNYYVNAGKFIDDNIDFLTDDKSIRLRLYEFSKKQEDISKLYEKTNLIINNSDDMNNKLRQFDNNIKEKDFPQGQLKEFEDINNRDLSDIGGGLNDITNKIKTNSQILNNKSSEQNDIKKNFISESNININEHSKIISESIKGKENKNINNNFNNINTIKKTAKFQDNKNNNYGNSVSFNMNDWSIREENTVKPLDMKKNNNNINTNIINTNTINNKNIINNDSLSDFEESFKEEKIPKNID